MKMRRSTRLAQNQPKREPQIKKSRLGDRISNISSMDNGTMVESLKYLNYMQLAQASFVSKRFSNLICTHRRSLALLYVNRISMTGPNRYAIPIIKICGKVMSLGKWDQWSSHYNYSKQIILKGQVAENQSKEIGRQVYEMHAEFIPNPWRSDEGTWRSNGTCVLHARVELNDEYWPLLQHFVCLLTDPFTYISHVQLTPRIDVFFLDLLAGAINPEYNRLQCNTMDMHLSMTNHENSIHKFIDWMKNCVYCNNFEIFHNRDSNFYGNAPKQLLRKVASEELLDFFVTGAHCTSAITINYCDISNAVVAFLQKFMDLQNNAENQIIETIEGTIDCRGLLKMLQGKCTTFSVVEKNDRGEWFCTKYDFEFVNNQIGKKLRLKFTITLDYPPTPFSLKIAHLQ